MEIEEYLKFRDDLILEAKDGDGMVTASSFAEMIIPDLMDVKLVDNTDFTETFYEATVDKVPLKINGYIINETEERMQLFIVNDDSLQKSSDNILINTKQYYDDQFKKALNFVKKSFAGALDTTQDVGAIKSLINHLSSSHGVSQYDVIEIFLVSPTVTIDTRGGYSLPRKIDFPDEKIPVRYKEENKRITKVFDVQRKLIDVNFIYDIKISQGRGCTLVINFENDYNYPIEALKGADEKTFETYLCVLPASILADMYKRHSTRLLEKNIRSFLQFPSKSVNAGMRHTLAKYPEKFIAFNNGLTVTADHGDIDIVDDKIFIKSLSNFQIVNGGQTTASIYFSHKDRIDISNVKVMAKINIVKDASEEEFEELISDISLYSNSQNKVKSVDLKSRNSQLVKIKSLSLITITPSGKYWFFEKSRGEFNTMLRMERGSRKDKIEKKFPAKSRFNKEELGKYFCSWGDEPYKVKKGGEKIFGEFIRAICPEEEEPVTIDRDFYELIISKVILFRNLEELHGRGKKAIGQLRSAVVPYSISVLYHFTDGNIDNPRKFDLIRLWKNEGLPKDLEDYMKELMTLMNELIKKYARSDDYGEYSKKKELWDDILISTELISFMTSKDSEFIISKYSSN